MIASARPLNDIHLRAQVLTHSEAEARGFTERVNTFLALVQVARYFDGLPAVPIPT